MTTSSSRRRRGHCCLRCATGPSRSSRRFTEDLAKRLDDLFGFKEVLAFRVVGVDDKGAGMTEVSIWVTYDTGRGPTDKVIRANVLCENATGSPVPRGEVGAVWGV